MWFKDNESQAVKLIKVMKSDAILHWRQKDQIVKIIEKVQPKGSQEINNYPLI